MIDLRASAEAQAFRARERPSDFVSTELMVEDGAAGPADRLSFARLLVRAIGGARAVPRHRGAPLVDSRVLLSLPSTLLLLPGADDEDGLRLLRNNLGGEPESEAGSVSVGRGMKTPWFPVSMAVEGRCSSGVLESIQRLDAGGFDASKGTAAGGGLPEVFGEVKVSMDAAPRSVNR